MTHVALLGDSIFDNGAYVPGEPDLVRQLRSMLPAGWRATLLAVDGATTLDVPRQIHRLPPDASHLVISTGGNDALGHIGVYDEAVSSMRQALARLASVVQAFSRDYEAMLDAVLARRLPSAVCTIYDPRFPDPDLQRFAVTALASFNDAIIRSAAVRGLPILDLRLICDMEEDYANPIEPSAIGAAKIAGAISNIVSGGGMRLGGNALIFVR